MATGPRIAFIGAGSTVFMKNIVFQKRNKPQSRNFSFPVQKIQVNEMFAQPLYLLERSIPMISIIFISKNYSRTRRRPKNWSEKKP